MLLSHVLTLILGSYITKLLHVKIYKETQIRVRGVGSGQVGGVLSLTSVLGVYIVNPGQLDTGQLDTGHLDTGQLDTHENGKVGQLDTSI